MKNIVDRFPDKTFETHPSDIQLAQFKEQKLNNEELQEIQKHLVECKRCRTILIEASRSLKESKLKPVNNIIYLKALSPLIAGAIIFVAVPIIDKPSSDIQYKNIEIEKNIFESSVEYWEKLYEKYFKK